MRKGESKRLSKDLIARLSGLGGVRRYERAELILKEGARADGVYVLLAGRAKVFTSDDEGRELIYNTISSGEIFGEMLLDGGTRSASVMAMTETDCVRIARQDLQDFITLHPDFAYALVLVLIARLRDATAQAKRLGLSDVAERVADVLSAEAENVEGDLFLPRALTQQEISQRIGATREMVNHVIRKFERAGYLARTPDRRLRVLKPLPGKESTPRR